MYHIKKAAQLSGVSVKTLHHYDKIGLLVPAKSENGYRTYSQADLERLQVILYYKYLGFSLEKIAELLSQDDQALLPHLVRQLEYLQQERDRLDTLISTLQKTIQEALTRQNGREEESAAAFNQVFQSLAENMQQGLPVEAAENQEQATRLLQAIRTYGFDCSIEVFGHIGKGYVYNPEFKENIDKFGSGTAQYTADVIAAYVRTNAK